METQAIKRILEAALLAAGRPLSLNDLEQLFTGDVDAPPRDAIRAALAELSEDWEARSLALQEVASGFRAQVREEFEPWLARMWDEKPPRYSRALLAGDYRLSPLRARKSRTSGGFRSARKSCAR